jgi:hypothetical protein
MPLGTGSDGGTADQEAMDLPILVERRFVASAANLTSPLDRTAAPRPRPARPAAVSEHHAAAEHLRRPAETLSAEAPDLTASGPPLDVVVQGLARPEGRRISGVHRGPAGNTAVRATVIAYAVNT